MRTRIAIALILLVLVACTSDAESPPSTTASVEEVAPESPTSEVTAEAELTDSSFEDGLEDLYERLEAQGFSGIVAVEGGGDAESQGFGLADVEAGEPWDLHTVFDIGSITKQFTGAAIVRLEMDGLLSVDDRLGDHVPYATSDLAEVTLHELLTHTAGLPGGLGDDYEPVSRTEIVDLAAAAVSEERGYNYSNPGYSMLGVVIEEVSGMSYEEYLREVFFDPLGMDSTGYVLPDYSDDVVAVGYDGETVWGRPDAQLWDTDGPYWYLRANGGILSTAADMMLWHEGLLGERVLDADAKDKLFARHVEEFGDSYYGYGWANFPLPDGETLITHNGGNGIFFADFLWFVDQDLTIVVGTNVAGADEEVAYQIADALLGTSLVDPVGEAGQSCAPGDMAGSVALADFPDGPHGDVLEDLLAAITSADDAERQAFATNRLADEVTVGASPTEVSTELAGVQEELAPFAFSEVRRGDDLTYYIVLVGTPESGGEVVVGVGLDPDDPSVISCVEFADN